MTDQSRYLRFLPPVLQLQTEEKDGSAVPVGQVLRLFEKVLTGIADGVSLQHRPAGQSVVHEHPALEQVIAGIHHLFDPWNVRPDFLPWLASWVALEFPTLQGQALWDEYQQRRAAADMAAVYRKRGLKAGLKHSLYLHTLGQGRPRIAIDDGSRLFFCRPQPSRYAPLHTLVSWGAWLQETDLNEGLFRPWCLAVLSQGELIVGDVGLADQGIEPRLWRVATTGDGEVVRLAPKTAAGADLDLRSPIGVCLGPASRDLYVLNRLDVSAELYEVKAPGYDTASKLNLAASAPKDAMVWPLAMDARQEGGKLHLFILDRGAGPDRSAKPKILDVDVGAKTITGYAVSGVTEPLSLVVLGNGAIIVGDNGKSKPARTPGNLIRIDRTSWQGSPVLPAEHNPLVAPTALVAVDTDYLYVLDAGLRPWVPDASNPFLSDVACEAAIYAVSIGGRTIERVSEAGQLVYPTGMALNAGTLIVVDPGIVKPGDEDLALWRARRHEFAVTVHFPWEALPADENERLSVERHVLGDIRAIVKREKPAHTLCTVLSEV